jgi:hypothetical protein
MDSQLCEMSPAWRDPPTEAAQDAGSPTKSGRQGVQQGRPRDRANQHLAALRAAWVSHTLKRAIAAVRSASDEDYRAFGWDRGELLAKLQCLHDESDLSSADRRKELTVTLARSGRPDCVRPEAEPRNDNHR